MAKETARTVRELFDISGRVALITGGSRGLGLQMAQALGEQGAQMILVARKQDELDGAVSALAAQGIAAHAIACDVAQHDQIPALISAIEKRFKQVDILVNNAGTARGGGLADCTLEEWDKVMNLNIRSIFYLTQAVGKTWMIPRRSGRIINISSICGLRGDPSDIPPTIAYGTSKGALINFTRCLAAEWGQYNITVNAIAPGFFPSKLTHGLIEHVGEKQLAERTPLRQLGDDEDLKGTVALFASDAGKHITGQILAVDAGITAIYG